MNTRTKRLREQSLAATPRISAERAQLLTQFYRENQGKHSIPVMRALAFRHLCQNKTIYIGQGELIVGERGPEPKATPTFPELTCHSVEDLQILNSREKISYAVSPQTIAVYENEIIPFWHGRSLRQQIFAILPDEWQQAYTAGIFTEFMEQRAPGHTVADGKIYRKGMLEFKKEVETTLSRLDFANDPHASAKQEQLKALSISAESVIIFAHRHAQLALKLASQEKNPQRKSELETIARVCYHVPAHAPRNFHEALQTYWFCHLAVITELNGWDAYSPGHLDQHLEPFFKQGLQTGTLTQQSAQELLECLFIKFNNHPAPPKVGVTAAESGTYTDFVNINLAGQRSDGSDGVSQLSYLLLEVINDLHLLQPGSNIQLSHKTPDRFLHEACRVIRNGYGFPSVFNSDIIVKQLLRQGKSLHDAREGGASGCVEAGAFGKEAYILTGYFNLPKILELTLNDGLDPRTGAHLGLRSSPPQEFASFDDLFQAWKKQLQHFVNIKLRGNHLIEHLYAQNMPAPFLSLITDDCIAKGIDYNAGGARYNTSYIQGVGIGTLTDSLAAIRKHIFSKQTISMHQLLNALKNNFQDNRRLRQLLLNRSPKWGTDDEEADELMQAAFNAYFQAIDGQPNNRGGEYHIDMLPTTCHIYFGSVVGATPDGRLGTAPLSEGISPSQGMDRQGPTAVLLSAGRMEHLKTGGTLLNMKFTPQTLAGESGLKKLCDLIRTYFKLGGHHIQFNVLNGDTLRRAMANPEDYRGLIVRVAGYSDYFCDLSHALQEEIISRTAHGENANSTSY